MSKDMTPVAETVQEIDLPAPTGPIVDHSWLDDDAPRIVSAAKLENERARGAAMQKGARGMKNRVWCCDGAFVYFRRKLAAMRTPDAPDGLNPLLVQRHNRMIANGEYKHVATQDDVEIYELQDSSPFKRKGVNLGETSFSQVRWIAIWAAVGKFPGQESFRDPDWGLFVDCIEEMASRIKGSYDSGWGKLKFEEELNYTMHLIQQAGGPPPAMIDHGVQQVRKRRGQSSGKVIMLPT